MRIPCLALLLCLVVIHGAEPARGKGGEAGTGGANAGAAEAKAVFARQAKDNPPPTGAAPAITGCYLWGGRADANYKPFFQWELLVHAGTADLPGLEARITTLSPERKPQGESAWTAVGDVASASAKPFAIRINTVQFHGWQVDLRWQGGQAAFVAGSKSGMPMAVTPGAGVLAVGIDAIVDSRNRRTEVVGSLWNLGASTARSVVLTIRLLDDNGKELGRHAWSPPGGTVPVGGSVPVALVIKGAPKVATTASSVSFAPAPMGFAMVDDVELGQVEAVDGQLIGRVRNGTKTAITGCTVTVRLLDAAGKALFTGAIPAGDLAPGGESPFAIPAPGVATWASVETSWAGR